MKLLVSVISLIILQSCQPKIEKDELIVWINSAKVECSGVGKMTCLQIQKNVELDLTQDWEFFYSNIEGFEYQPGYFYKLKVKTEKIENPPADGSSIKYTLVKALEKKEDLRYTIHDIYALTNINGKNVSSENVEQTPTLEINVSKMEILGTNGCNNFGGSISKLEGDKIEFGQLRETLKMCEHMDVSSLYSKELGNVRSFKKEHGALVFYNSENKIILSFKKVD
ncbi:DUF4377 domain-containing protein [Urechidicola vernalis]|uniref:DUF4377 domain-containing protein n=1 Tax=Urechidicola vernalis TaxID=3075600 RepID=A0ABU2Y878_9FLAO|nr:DUF4377 domain-containing protein [Urechidicola sp. P050]MDT0553859.1 DUF4377 domain-containing protein [Urechidicola sp. P050]